MEVNKKAVGRRVKSIRLALGMTLEEFGKLFGANKANVHNWEKGRNIPNKRRLRKIADLNDKTVDELLYGTGDAVELTKVEKQIIAAYRDGANVKVTYFTSDNKDLEEAIDKVMRFGKVTDFIDLTDEGSRDRTSFVSIENTDHERLEINAFIEVQRKSH